MYLKYHSRRREQRLWWGEKMWECINEEEEKEKGIFGTNQKDLILARNVCPSTMLLRMLVWMMTLRIPMLLLFH